MRNQALRRYCTKHSNYILVRTKVNGIWGEYPLSQLPVTEQRKNILYWEQHGIVPEPTFPKCDAKT